MEPRRVPLKAHNSNWKEKLRDNCFKRIREDRNKLLWKMRAPSQPSHKEVMELTFRDIVTDELKRIKDSSFPVFVDDDVLWEYDGLQKTEGECEEILIEMQRIFYEDLRTEETTRALAGKMEYDGTWEEDDDDYLVKAALEQLQLSNDQIGKNAVWCPMCKQGELKEDHYLIYCTLCKLQLTRGDEVNLDILRERLAEAHADHLDRGCRLAPKFCMETRFSLTALYIQCEACNTFEIVS